MALPCCSEPLTSSSRHSGILSFPKEAFSLSLDLPHYTQKILNMRMSLDAHIPSWSPSTSSAKGPGLYALGRPVVRAGGFSDRVHSLRCRVCPMKSAQHPGITMRAEQFWKINKPLELSIASLYREITACHSLSVSLCVLFCLFLHSLLSFYFHINTQNHKIRHTQ